MYTYTHVFNIGTLFCEKAKRAYLLRLTTTRTIATFEKVTQAFLLCMQGRSLPFSVVSTVDNLLHRRLVQSSVCAAEAAVCRLLLLLLLEGSIMYYV
jgi:hypothetical protein